MREEKLVVVIPCYDEEEIIDDSMSALEEKLHDMISSGLVSDESMLLFVNDGSADSTRARIEGRTISHGHVKVLSLPRNMGHQMALLMGMEHAFHLMGADIIISIDADLQDDIGCFDEMIRLHGSGAHIVTGVRKSRGTDSFMKRHTAGIYYGICSLIAGRRIENSADFRLVDREAYSSFERYSAGMPDDKKYLRGIFSVIDCESAFVYYDRRERTAGATKYTIPKMVMLALHGMSFYMRARLQSSE